MASRLTDIVLSLTHSDMASSDINDSRHLFSADRPITDSDSDKLERGSFAEALARAIRGWQDRDSLVIALYGPWGAGKSSIKNLVVGNLSRQSGQSVPIVAEFNPWQFANREQLLEAFFDEIGVALGKGTCASDKDKKRLLQRWRRYAASLRAGAGLVAHIRSPLVTVLVFAAVGIGIGATSAYLTASIFALILLLLAALLHWWSKFAEYVAGFMEASVANGKRSFEEVKAELASELRSLQAPLLVVIDDVDRLVPSEALELFQLIKVNANFPNLVYLVLFDRSVVEANIEEVLKVSGREYLEKIVQVGFDVPAIQRAQLDRVLFSGLDQLLSDPAILKRFDRQRWGNLFLGGLQEHFSTLRDVNRFLSALSFQISLFRAEKSFEVNPVDLIGVEVLRVFHPSVYHTIAGNKRLLTRGVRRAERSEEQRDAILTIAQSASKSQETVKEIIKQLFPSVEWALGGANYGDAFENQWYRELRICSENVFDRYFTFAIAADDVSQAMIDRILSLTNDRAGLRSELLQLKERGLLPIVLHRMEAYKEHIPLEHGEAFITALFDSCDDVSSARSSIFEISPMMHAVRIVHWFLRRDLNATSRFQVLLACIRASQGISLPVYLVSLQSPHQSGEGERSRILTNQDDVADLQSLCLKKLQHAAASGQLARCSNLSLLLFRWREWGGENEPRAFVAQMTSTPSGAIKFLRAFLSRSTSYGTDDYVGKERWYIKLDHIEMFVPWESLEALIKDVPQASPDADEGHEAVRAFQEAVRRRREGKADIGTGDSDDDDLD